jgi:hypothetical protein
MKNKLVGLAVGALLFVALPASASMSFAVTAFNANGFGQNTSVNFVEGFRFRPNQDIFVQEVGFYDSFSNGLIKSYKVGIVAPDNTILGSAIVPAGTGGRLDGPVDPGGDLLSGAFRYAALESPLHLISGNTYALVALITRTTTDQLPGTPIITYNNLLTVSGADLGGFFDCSVTNGPCSDKITQISDIRYPTKFSSGSRYLNFTFTPVPLPAAFPLFAMGLGVMGSLISRGKRRL